MPSYDWDNNDGRGVPGRVEDGLEDAFEHGLPKLGRSVWRGATRLVRRVRHKGSQVEKVVEPDKIAHAIVGEAAVNSYAIDTQGEQLAAPSYYFVTVPWVSWQRIYQPYMAQVVANIEQDVQRTLASNRYRIMIQPHVAIGLGGQLPDDKVQVTVCFSQAEWMQLRGEVVPTPGESPSGAASTAPEYGQQGQGWQAQPRQARSPMGSGPASAPSDGRTMLDVDVPGQAGEAASAPVAEAYVILPGRADPLRVSDGATIGRPHGTPGKGDPDLPLPRGFEDPRIRYVSHVNGAFRQVSDGTGTHWAYEQLGPNITVVAHAGGGTQECVQGSDPVPLGDGDRLYLSRMQVPVEFHEGVPLRGVALDRTVLDPRAHR